MYHESTDIYRDAHGIIVQIILITDDQSYANTVIAGFALSQRVYIVSQITGRSAVSTDFERIVDSVSEQHPVIVIVDFETLKELSIHIVPRVLAMQSRIAIECLITRTPGEGSELHRLRRLGVTLSEPIARTHIFPVVLH